MVPVTFVPYQISSSAITYSGFEDDRFQDDHFHYVVIHPESTSQIRVCMSNVRLNSAPYLQLPPPVAVPQGHTSVELLLQANDTDIDFGDTLQFSVMQVDPLATISVRSFDVTDSYKLSPEDLQIPQTYVSSENHISSLRLALSLEGLQISQHAVPVHPSLLAELRLPNGTLGYQMTIPIKVEDDGGLTDIKPLVVLWTTSSLLECNTSDAWRAGIPGRSFILDGTASLTLPAINSFDIAEGFTIELWLALHNRPGTSTILQMGEIVVGVQVLCCQCVASAIRHVCKNRKQLGAIMHIRTV
jgi:hypothetical protein